jgi:hypothetical protein
VKIKRSVFEFLRNVNNPILLVLLIFLSWISVFIISVIAKVIFGDMSDAIMNYNPLVNGFIHGDWSHLMWNLGLIFIFLLPAINQQYTFTQVYFITLIISLIYFPIALLIALPAVGISGTMYFMMTRACLYKKNVILYTFFTIMFGSEIANCRVVSDGSAHSVHIIGSVLGFISLHIKGNTFNKYKLVQQVSNKITSEPKCNQ